MIIVGIEHITNLVMREKRNNPKAGALLEKHIQAWKQQIEIAKWKMPTDVKAVFRSADPVGDGRIIFNIRGNHYRLVVQFNYPAGIARIRFAGTHVEYDKIDVKEI